MAVVQTNYGPRDPNDKDCRTCHYWDGDRSWPTDEGWIGHCSLPLPPYLLALVDGKPETRATDRCHTHRYYSRT